MSDEIIIRVEKLGKRYRIQHQQQGRRYVALRDVIAQKFAAPFRFLKRSQKSEARSQTSDIRPPASTPASQEDFWALKDVSFEVRQGEVVGIIGRNGAGKSTLLKILSRITEPTEGRVRIKGRVASLLEVGTGFHPELTGRENIFLNGAILGMHRMEIKRKFDEIVAFAEVERFLDTPVKRYSSGMYVRLAFAVAAHLEPEILIVDEVLAVGDAEFQKKCLGKMQDVASGGRTVLFVSHNMSSIVKLCTKSLFLEKGKVNTFNETSAVISEYRTTSESHGNQTISPRNNRVGNGKVRIQNISMLDEAGKCIHVVSNSKPLIIRLQYKVTERLNKVDFVISVRTLTDDRLFLCSSNHDAGLFDLSEGTGEVDCRIGSMPLAPGSYSLNVAAQRHLEMFDWVSNAFTFEVIDSGYYKYNAESQINHSPFLVQSTWSLSGK